jgi:hypothetical protein
MKESWLIPLSARRCLSAINDRFWINDFGGAVCHTDFAASPRTQPNSSPWSELCRLRAGTQEAKECHYPCVIFWMQRSWENEC